VIGDQLTCKNIRGCKLWRQPEIDPIERLTWANEIPGVHFLEKVCTCATIDITGFNYYYRRLPLLVGVLTCGIFNLLGKSIATRVTL
jgi:hypothetical protein